MKQLSCNEMRRVCGEFGDTLITPFGKFSYAVQLWTNCPLYANLPVLTALTMPSRFGTISYDLTKPDNLPGFVFMTAFPDAKWDDWTWR